MLKAKYYTEQLSADGHEIQIKSELLRVFSQEMAKVLNDIRAIEIDFYEKVEGGFKKLILVAQVEFNE